MLPYIPHVALLVALFYIFYKLLLEKETFFQLNRWFLVVGGILAFIIPSFVIPADWSIWPAPVSESTSYTYTNEVPGIVPAIPPQPEAEAKTAIADQNTVPPKPAASVEKEPMSTVAATPSIWSQLNWKDYLWYGYLAGIAIFGINLLIQMLVLAYQMIKFPSLKDGPYRIIEMEQDKAPYSFLNAIFINPTKYDWDTYNQILEHEKIHVSQLHSIDMILAELLVVVQWFNPFAWYYRKAVENNLEYLTDHAMLNKGTAREPYQLNLLKVSVPHYPIGLAMNYNQSILKKRIKMMNGKKSSVRTSWKYMAILPLIGISVICFNAVKLAANQQEQTTDFEEIALEEIMPDMEEVFNEMEEPLQSIGEIAEEFASGIAEEALRQAQIALENVPFEQESFSFNGELPLEMKGFWRAEIEGDRICIRFDNSDFSRNSFWVSTECFKRSEFGSLPSSDSEFKLSRAAGTITFKGSFDGDYGDGRYTFQYDQSFGQLLEEEGIRGRAKESDYFHFFLADMDQDFVRNLKQKNFSGLDVESLRKVAIHGVTESYIDEMAKLGFDDLDIDDLIKGRIHDVDPQYIQEIRGAGFKNMDFDDLVKFSIHDVDAEMVEALARAGFTDLDAQDIVKASIHNVDPEYIAELKEVGYTFDDLDDIVKFAIHNVDADLVKALKDAGYDNLSPGEITKAAIHNVDEKYIADISSIGYEFNDIDNIIDFAIHNVDANFVKALKEAGYDDISARDIKNAAIHNVSERYINDLRSAGIDLPDLDEVVKFKIHNVSVSFIEALEDAGYKNLEPEQIRSAAIHNISESYIREMKASGIDLPSIEEVIKFKIHNVSPRYIKDLQDLGYSNLSAGDVRKAAIHNVRPSFIKGLNDLGFDNIPMDKVINLKIHNVTPSFIKGAREKGYKDLSLEEYKKIKIHNLYRE